VSSRKNYTETQFLTALDCGNLLNLNHNNYQLDQSQKITLKTLQNFYISIYEMTVIEDIDYLLYSAFLKTVSPIMHNYPDSWFKETFSFAASFIYCFLNKYPPNKFKPIYTDLNLPFSYEKYNIIFNYQFVLHDVSLKKKDRQIYVFDFLQKNDNQITRNNLYYLNKYKFVFDKISLILGKDKINYVLFYFSNNSRNKLVANEFIFDNFLYTPKDLPKVSSLDIYMQKFYLNLKIPTYPFCVNFKCPKRKECLK
jgi:hypothetical protein